MLGIDAVLGFIVAVKFLFFMNEIGGSWRNDLFEISLYLSLFASQNKLFQGTQIRIPK